MGCQDCARLKPYGIKCKRCVKERPAPAPAPAPGAFYDYFKAAREKARERAERKEEAEKIYTWQDITGPCGHRQTWYRSGDSAFSYQLERAEDGCTKPEGHGWWLRCMSCNPFSSWS